MKQFASHLISILTCLLFILSSSTSGFSQTNFCKGDGLNWFQRLIKGGPEKRIDACFGRYQPSGFDPNTPKVVWDASADNFTTLQNEINDLADFLVNPANDLKDRRLLYFNEIFTKANNTAFNDFDYWNKDLKKGEPGHKKTKEFFEAAAVAKYAAFVYLVGVIKVPNPSNPSQFVLKKFDDPSLPTGTGILKLNEFRDRALNILEHLKKSGAQDFKPAAVIQKYFGHYRYKELIGFLSAFELLRMATTISNRDLTIGELELSKLALQGTVQNLYHNTGALIEGASNNHTLIYAGALGLAAIVLHDCGSGKFKKSWHPNKWAEKAHWHTEHTLFANEDRQRMTEENAMAGYAEGPHYFIYAFESLVPFLIAYRNSVPENHTEEVDAGVWRGKLTVQNHDTKEKFHNLYQWFNQIQTPANIYMPYDASFINRNYPYFMQIVNHGKHFHQPITSFGIRTLYHPDVIASKNPMIKKEDKLKQFFVNNASGNIVLQSPFSMPDSNRIQIQLLAETGVAVNVGRHEHADANSVTVSAGNDMLIFDPGSSSYNDRKWFNAGDDHNIFTINDKDMDVDKTRNATGVKENSLITTDKTASAEARVFYRNTTVDRKVSYFNSSNAQYVVSNDRTDEDDWWENEAEFKMILSGNGNADAGTFVQIPGENGMFQWTHPCSERPSTPGTYSIQTYTAVFGGIDGIEIITDDDEEDGKLTKSATVNDNGNSYICNSTTKKISDDKEKTVGIHTKVRILKNDDDHAHFLTVYWPFKCTGSPPIMKKKEDWNSALITIEGVGDEEWTEFLAMSQAGPVTINNPVDRNALEKLEFNASDMHLSISKVGYKSFKECKAYTKFRSASISNGTSLKYNDTSYITATEDITFGYDLAGKYRYQGYVKNEGGSASIVTIFLPDLVPFHDMIIKNEATNQEITSTYNDITRKLTFSVDPEENIRFIIELANPCILSCFFPETDTTIYYTFNFDEGTLETLGHHLDIIQSSGHLKITNGSKMFICEDNLLVNKDSITMRGFYGEPEDGYTLPGKTTSPGEGPSGAGVRGGSKSYGDRLGSKRSMIIVDDKAGLILESNSRTHIGSNSTIYIKDGGTLLVENDAEVEIGGEGLGTGELIAEGGARVCINDDANLHFFVNEFDSSDKNIFYVAMGSPPNRSFSQVNMDGIKGKFKTDSIYDAANYFCLEFCDLKNFLLPHGINDRDFGWSNISEPLAKIEMKDTFCAGEAVLAGLTKTLNETQYYLKIAEWDTLLHLPIISTVSFVPDTVMVGWDSSRAVNKSLSDLYSYLFVPGKHYVVYFGIENDCNVGDLASNVFYIQQTPHVELLVPSTACPGFETFEADGTGSEFGTSYLWSVTRSINTQNEHLEDPNESDPEGVYKDTTGNGAVYDDMKFPDFHFKGGFMYDIALTAYNVCGEASVTETVEIPLSANVSAATDVIIAGGIPSSTQLDGVITGTSTFSWSPTIILSNPSILTPIATPTSSLNIVLTATDGTCSESDTIHISVNLYANAGLDKTICYGSSVMIGSSISSLPLGYSISWSPSTGLSNPAIDQPAASPDTSTTYTMSIFDALSNLVEKDEVLVTVLDTLASGFIIEQTDTLEFNFINLTTEVSGSNSYNWSFGDGASSSYVNPGHTYYNYEKDTAYEVCLIANNLCASDTFCDSLRIDSIGRAYDQRMILLPHQKQFIDKFRGSITDISASEERLETPFSPKLSVRPNPFVKTTEILVNYDTSLYHQLDLTVYEVSGKIIKSYNVKKLGKSIVLNLSGCRSGTYYARLITDGEVRETVKLILLN